MASKAALLQAVKNYEELIDWLNTHVAPQTPQESRPKLLQAVKMGYKDVAMLTTFIEDEKDEDVK